MPINRVVKKGQTILYQGEVPSSVFVIKSGLVRALNVNPNGEERTIALFGPTEYFPVGVAFDKSQVALLYYESMTKTELELYSKAEFTDMMVKSGYNETDKLARQYVSSLLQINALGFTLAKDRVAHILQFLCLRFGRELKGGEIKIDLPLTHLDIARLAGLTRETTAIEVGNLKKAKIISTNKKYYKVRIKELLKSMNNEEFGGIKL